MVAARLQRRLRRAGLRSPLPPARAQRGRRVRVARRPRARRLLAGAVASGLCRRDRPAAAQRARRHARLDAPGAARGGRHGAALADLGPLRVAQRVARGSRGRLHRRRLPAVPREAARGAGSHGPRSRDPGPGGACLARARGAPAAEARLLRHGRCRHAGPLRRPALPGDGLPLGRAARHGLAARRAGGLGGLARRGRRIGPARGAFARRPAGDRAGRPALPLGRGRRPGALRGRGDPAGPGARPTVGRQPRDRLGAGLRVESSGGRQGAGRLAARVGPRGRRAALVAHAPRPPAGVGRGRLCRRPPAGGRRGPRHLLAPASRRPARRGRPAAGARTRRRGRAR